MLTYLLSIIGLVVLCVLWVLFQLWLGKHDPQHRANSIQCGGCKDPCGEMLQEKKPEETTAPTD